MWSSQLHSQASTKVVTCASRLRNVVTTPLGRPVVPLVYIMSARRSGPSEGKGETPAAAPGGCATRSEESST